MKFPFWRRQRDEELDAEIHSHLDEAIRDRIARGESPAEAARAARREFGNVDLVRDVTRDTWGWTWLEQFVQDLRYGARQLRRSPGFTAVAVFTLALGIGANTAIFSMVDAVILRHLPVERPAELERLEGYYSNPMYRELRERNQVFSGLIARQTVPVSLIVNGQTDRGVAELVSGNYFSVLGVRPLLGRTLLDEDDTTPMSHPVVVLSHRFWRQRFAADAGVVGQTIRIDDYLFTVVGVAPSSFSGIEVGSAPDFWIPITMQPQVFERSYQVLDNTGMAWLEVMGRRKPGLNEAAARAGIVVTLQRIAQEGRHKLYRNMPARALIQLFPGDVGFSELRDQFASPLYLLMAVVALVLLIACINLANLLLARSAGRRREIAVRLALGAGRQRLLRQLMTESVLLSILGGSLGVVFCTWLSQLLIRFLPAHVGTQSIPLSLDIQLDARVLVFALGISVVTGILFGLAPAIQATRPHVAMALKDEGSSQRPRAHRLQTGKALVVSQVALSLLLLVVAALFLRSLRSASSIELGLRIDNVLMATINPELSGYSAAQEAGLMRQLLTRLQGLPGVQGVAVSAVPLLAGGEDGGGFIVPGQPLPPVFADRGVSLNRVGGDFFSLMGVTILRGRNFGPQDTSASPPVVIITESVASHFFSGLDPVGKRVKLRGVDNVEIIGIARDSKYSSVTAATPRIAYISLDQTDLFFGSGERTIYLRTQSAPRALIASLRGELQSLDKNLPLYDVTTLADQKNESLYQERLVATLSGFFGALALLLASIGLYGVMAYNVSRRTREIGVRMSLGASQAAVLWMVLRDCLQMVLVGIVIGVPLSLWLSGLIKSLLFGITPADPLAFAGATLVLVVVGAIAGFLPSYRASRVDPMIALRYE